MAKLFGKTLGRDEILRRVGDMSQVAGASLREFLDGPARGSRAVDVWTGSGLRFTLLPDRALDIAAAEHSGRSLCWRSGTAETHPGFYQPEGAEWLYSFYGGLMVTCGLTYYGAPCVDEGVPLGLHGRVGNIPARNVAIETGWKGDDYFVAVKGTVAEVQVFGARLRLDRRFTVWAGEDRIELHDEVTNFGHAPCPHMMLYHCNFGYPVVSDRSRLVAPTKVLTPRDAGSEDGQEKYAEFHGPTEGWSEKVYYHDLYTARGETLAGIVNPEIGFGGYLKFRPSQLPRMVEWKQLGMGEYVVGLEPCTNRVEGRDVDRALGQLRFLEAGEKVVYDLELGALPDAEAAKKFESSVASIARDRGPEFKTNPQPMA